MKFKQLLEKLESQISKLNLDDRKDVSSQDYKNSNLNCLGIRVPVLRKFKFQSIEDFSYQERFDFFDYAFNTSNISEILSWVCYEIKKFDLKFLLQNKVQLLQWSFKIENWWHSDELSSIYVRMFDKQKLMYQIFQDWAEHGTNWQKRLSLTSIIYYSSQREHVLGSELAFSQVKKLLFDEDYYVQKGLGWALRECYNSYPQKTKEFLELHIKELSATAFTAATEKLDQNFKEKLKEIRKPYESNPKKFLEDSL